jgi:putative ABC transport system permease protein
MSWILKMAWRDSRASRRRLALFSMAIVFGVGALVSIRSFGHNLETAVEEQSKTLLGADLVIGGRTAFTPQIEALLKPIGTRQAREVSFSSMVYFPTTEESRLVQVRGLKGAFPFYGEMETVPANARDRLEEGHYALLEESVMVQFDVQAGDEVRIGNQIFEVAGALRRVPGEMAAVGLLAPRVYIPHDSLQATGLLQRGSLARYKAFIELEPGTDVEALITSIRPQLRSFRLWAETVERRKEELGRTLENVQAFFQLVGFIALLLGSIGVASAVHVYVKRKVGTAAVLRCLGASARQAFGIYLVQGMALGVAGAAAGALMGVSLQMLFPSLLKEFLPFEVPLFVSWKAVAEGFAVGFFICVVFSLLPLLAIRRVSPLRAIRRGENFERERRRDPLRWAVYVVIAGAVVGFGVFQTGNLKLGLGISGGIAAAFLALAGSALLITTLAKRFFPQSWPYVWRQGFANLHRPENRTVLLMLALGLGTFLVFTLYLSRGALLQQVTIAGEGDHPTMALFDIQDDQRAEVKRILQEMDLPVLQDIPIVTMRLTAVNDKTIEAIMRDPDRVVPDWVLRREYRSTYRSHLVSTEHVVAGKWVESVDEDAEVVPVSVEQGIASDLGLEIGDTLTFDVQGVPIETVVGSIRKVEWQRVQPNFFIVFPAGVLEPAPKFHVMVTRTETDEQSAALQRTIVRQFSNISAIDLSLIIQTLDSIMARVAFVIRFMAMFTVLTGLVVLASAVATSRFQRMQEAILLRTLGASRRQVVQIMLLEYLFLGVLAGLAGTLLALGGAWALAALVFKVPFTISLVAPFVAVGGTAAVTVSVGLASSQGLLDQPPLEVLRAES